MTIALIRTPYEPILGTNAMGLTGHLYVGLEDLDPVTNSKAVYWDITGTMPAEQPLDVQGGYVMRDGTPAKFYTDGRFSIRAETMGGRQVWESRSEGPEESAAGEGAYEKEFTTLDTIVDGDWFALNFTRAIQFPTNFLGSSGRGRATTNTTCTIKKNCTIGADETLSGGTIIGTIIFHADGSVPTFATVGSTPTVAAGDAYFFIFTESNDLVHASACFKGAVIA